MQGNRAAGLIESLVAAGWERVEDEAWTVPAEAVAVEVPSGAQAYTWAEPTQERVRFAMPDARQLGPPCRVFRSSPRLSGVRRRTHGTRRRAANPVRRKSSSSSRGDPDLDSDPEPPRAPQGRGASFELGRVDRSPLLWRARAARCRWHEWREGWPE